MQEINLRRLAKIETEIESLLKQVSPFIIKIGHLRAEAALLTAENTSEEQNREIPKT